MKHSLSSIAFILATILLLVGVVACDESPPRDTALFEQAEELLRGGDYEGASQAYEAFLSSHPASPLAPLAEQRLLNIDRELEAVMGRRAAPAPIYIKPAETEAEALAPPERR